MDIMTKLYNRFIDSIILVLRHYFAIVSTVKTDSEMRINNLFVYFWAI